MSRRKRIPPLSEAGFQAQVIQFARIQGWLCVHFRGARIQRADGTTYHATPVQADGAGLPDLLLVRERAVWAELKTDRGRLTPAQQAWLERLRAAGCEAHVWHPRNWDEIERVLGR